MNTLQYKVIKTEKQYNQYCKELEGLASLKKKSKDQKDIIDLLTVLIEKWDTEYNSFGDADPIELLRFLMTENQLKSIDLSTDLGISTSLVSDILNYRRSLSKDMIRKLSEKFKINQQLFNRPYQLISAVDPHLKDPGEINKQKRRKQLLSQ